MDTELARVKVFALSSHWPPVSRPQTKELVLTPVLQGVIGVSPSVPTVVKSLVSIPPIYVDLRAQTNLSGKTARIRGCSKSCLYNSPASPRLQ